MTHAASLVFAGLIAGTAAHAADASRQTAAAVGAADREFARRAGEIGTAAAFRDYMDPDEGLAFTGAGKPAHGSAAIFSAIARQSPDSCTLHWIPLSAWGSKGGDMGVTTGDWAQTKKDGHTPLTTGRYVTVWRKDPKGQWRGLINIGEPDARPEANEATR